MVDNQFKLDEGFEEIPVEENDSLDEGFEEIPLDVSYGESFRRGAEQGASLGFYDELAGATEASGEAVGLKGLGGPISDVTTTSPKALDLEALLNAYRSRRDIERGATKQAEEANPKTALAGGLVGGLALPIGMTGKAFKEASTAQKLLKTADTGGRLGMGFGVGSSEADLTKPSAEEFNKLASDVETNALGGALAGPILHTGVEGAKLGAKALAYPIKKMSNVITEIPAVQNVIETGKLAAEGVKVTGIKAYKRIGDEASKWSQRLNESFFNQGNRLAKNQTKALEESNEVINIYDSLKNFQEGAQKLPTDMEANISDKAKIPNVISNIVNEHANLTDEQANLLGKTQTQIEKIESVINEVNKNNQKNADDVKTAFNSLNKQKEALLKELNKKQTEVQKHNKLVQNKIDLLKAKKEKLLQNPTTEISPIELENLDDTIIKFENQLNNDSIIDNAEINNIDDMLKQLKDPANQERHEIDPRLMETLDKLKFIENYIHNAKIENLKAVPPTTAKRVVKVLSDLSKQQTNDPLNAQLKGEGAGLAGNIAKDLQNQLYSKIEPYNKVNEQIKGYNTPLEEIGLKSVNQPYQSPTEVGSAENKILNYVSGVEKDSEGAIKSRAAVEKMVEAASAIDPRYSKVVSEKTKDISKRLALSKASIGGGGASSSVLNLAGRAQGVADFAGKMVYDLNNATPQVLKDAAAKVSQMGNEGAELARILSKAADADTRKKQAMIFSIMQNPAYRKLLTGNKDERSK